MDGYPFSELLVFALTMRFKLPPPPPEQCDFRCVVMYHVICRRFCGFQPSLFFSTRRFDDCRARVSVVSVSQNTCLWGERVKRGI